MEDKRKRLFLLDGMALVYRAHFAFAGRPIINSKGLNTSALFGLVNTLLDLIESQTPSHMALVFDTPEPTARHKLYPEYKAQREAMPEDLSLALPHVERLAKAFNIPLLKYPGFEADDVIGTLAKKAEREGFSVYMVTPDKDFSQLVSPNIHLYKPSRKGEEAEVLGVAEVLAKWKIKHVEQVIDILGLWGDASDNIPGIPGIGEKTAQKLINEYGSIEHLIESADNLKGKQKERVQAFGDQGLLSKQLATIDLQVPSPFSEKELECKPYDEPALRELFQEFEFNALGKRLFGDDFKSGRGFDSNEARSTVLPLVEDQLSFPEVTLKTINDTPHEYQTIETEEALKSVIERFQEKGRFCFDLETTSLEPSDASILGIAFSITPHQGCFLKLPGDRVEQEPFLTLLSPLFLDTSIEKIGHNLKYDLSVLAWHDQGVNGPFFDTMIAHALIEPEQRHGMDYLAERYLGYTPIPLTQLIGTDKKSSLPMTEVPSEELAKYACEDADITLQLFHKLKPQLEEKSQNRVFYDVESPLIPVLVNMEKEGIRLDQQALKTFSSQLQEDIDAAHQEVQTLAGREFNLNSPKQLGEILFDELKLIDRPKKTKTGQYATNEQVLQSLAPQHPIVRRLLDYRASSKLKSTYVDALPDQISPVTGRVHTTYNQAVTVTGRLQSQNPNLQNIPIRSEQGKEIRKSFIARNSNFRLLAADYSQIELRIIASLSGDPAMKEAFEKNLDIHAATAARIYGLEVDAIDTDMRRKAKMVNFGLAYGMSAFGLSQRLGIPRAEAKSIMDTYFEQFPRIHTFMETTIETAREQGYIETLTGRRRYLRDINSRNGTIRAGAERNAINMPVQGTAADMIKIAMAKIHSEISHAGLRSRMLLQVHDELVFDVAQEEIDSLKAIIRPAMEQAIPMEVPIKVEIGIGQTWLEAH